MPDAVYTREGSSGNGKIKSTYWLWSFVFFMLAFGIVVYYFSDIRKGFLFLKRVNIYLLLVALLTQFLTYVFSAMVYFSLLKGYKPKQMPGRWELIKASIVLLFFNQTIPSAGVSGNAFFFRFLYRYKISRAKSISLILVELLVFYAAMEFIIILLLLACVVIYDVRFAFKGALVMGMFAYLVFGSLILLAEKKDILNRLLERALRLRIAKWLFKRLRGRFPEESHLRDEIRVATVIKKNRGAVFRAFFSQLLLVVTDSCTLYVLFLGIGYPVSPFIVVLTLICTKIISILPSLPGGLILYEGSMSFFFTSAGIPVGTAVVLTLGYRLLSFWLPIPFGTILYRKWANNDLSHD